MHARYFVAVLAITTAGCAQMSREQAVLTPTSERAVVATRASRPSAPTGRLEAGTAVSITIQDTVITGQQQVGDLISAVLDRDLKDAKGALVLPAGAEVQLTIFAFQQPMSRRDDARMLFDISTVMVGSQVYTFETPVRVAVKAQAIGSRMMDSPVTAYVIKGGTRAGFTLPQAVSLL